MVRRRDGGADTGPEGAGASMIPVPSGVRVFIAAGATDMRRGMNGLAIQVRISRDGERGFQRIVSSDFAGS